MRTSFSVNDMTIHRIVEQEHTDTWCCTAHFPSPSAGHIKRWGDGFRLEYAKQ